MQPTFVFDLGPIIMGPSGVHIATLLGFRYETWVWLAIGFLLSYLINLGLAAVVLHNSGNSLKRI